jgi:nucleoside 2-deoxyribosyltransferase
MRKRVYVGGSISHLPTKVAYNRLNNIAVELRNIGYEATHSLVRIFDHIDENTVIQPTGHTETHHVTDSSVFNRCLYDIRNSDIIVFNFLGAEKVSIGSVFELAVAYEHNKCVIVLMEDDNIHQHLFILQSTCSIFTNVNDMLQYLEV